MRPDATLRAVVAGLMSLLVLFQASAAAAQSYPRTELPGWTIEQVRETNCNATSRYDSGNVITLMVTSTRELHVTLSNPKWEGLRDFNGSVMLTYVCPDRTFTETARKSADTEPGLTAVFSMADSTAFLELWNRSPSLIVSAGADRLVGLSLGGAPAAMTALKQCLNAAGLRRTQIMAAGEAEVEANAARNAEITQHNDECRAGKARNDADRNRLQSDQAQYDEDRSSYDFRLATFHTFRNTAAANNFKNYDDSQQAAALNAELRDLKTRGADLDRRHRAFNDRIDRWNADCAS